MYAVNDLIYNSYLVFIKLIKIISCLNTFNNIKSETKFFRKNVKSNKKKGLQITGKIIKWDNFAYLNWTYNIQYTLKLLYTIHKLHMYYVCQQRCFIIYMYSVNFGKDSRKPAKNIKSWSKTFPLFSASVLGLCLEHIDSPV